MVLNPWKVQSIDEFNYFCCPECVFRAKEDSSFQAHALQNHVLSKTLFHGTEENDLGQGNLFIIKGYCQLIGCGSIYGTRTKSVPLKTVSVTIFLYFSLKQKTVLAI